MNGEHPTGPAEGAEPGTLPPALLAEIYRHATEGYPEEVCGLVSGPRGGALDEVRRCRNVQNDLHARDPERHPRSAATAYALGIEDIARLDGSLGGPRPVAVLYHSHVDVGAYFSEEDKRMAAPPGWGPLYPQVDYLVVDVRKDGAREAVRFRHRDGDFVEVARYTADGTCR